MKFGYGEERKSHNSPLQRQVSAELCRARNRANKGKTYEQIYGPEKAAEMRERARERAQTGGWVSKRKGKTMEEIFGKKRAEEIKEKLRNARIKGRTTYITEDEKMADTTWKVMLLPSVKPWRSTASDSLFCGGREFVSSGAGRRW